MGIYEIESNHSYILSANSLLYLSSIIISWKNTITLHKWVRFSEKYEDCQQPQNWLNGSDPLVYDRVSCEYLEIYLILKLDQGWVFNDYFTK